MTDFNPAQMASQMATYYVQGAKAQLDMQSKASKGRSDALASLQKSLQDFRSALDGLGAKKNMLAMSATVSPDGAATATATGKAQGGRYSLFVEQVASAHQISFVPPNGLAVASGETLTVNVGAKSFSISLKDADTDGVSGLSSTEIARAINQHKDNAGKVSAGVVTGQDGSSTLILSAGQTGAANTITLSSGNAALAGALTAPKQLTEARDAVVWMGAKGTGVKLTQASNAFAVVDGVTLNLSKAQGAGDAPLVLNVARSDTDTAANVQGFVDGYNALLKNINSLTVAGNAEKGQAAGAFASDASVRALRERLNSLIRQDFGGVKLSDMGISAARDGTLTLDKSKLGKLLDSKPDALDSFFNGTTASGGLLKAGSSYLDTWLSSTKGVLKQRRDSETGLKADLDKRQSRIDQDYDQAYQRYLKQYSQLQQLQTQMAKTVEMLNSNLGV
ncbi:flagellar filament capping protein FliD [Craterilacuibacter sinensis]|uniref:Flagellar hook-associated protein 2 n=1 Tax=Craterilacuibacter sinensis TaxID=2686017 RepID=A0A845BKK7_9NEIS|nr:flagellar filament capping protein FliD [Craterilacuibacter sinensis]MXR35814.1 flagellar filament capping protein FliD [Craterilacuibacter sinensis]